MRMRVCMLEEQAHVVEEKVRVCLCTYTHIYTHSRMFDVRHTHTYRDVYVCVWYDWLTVYYEYSCLLEVDRDAFKRKAMWNQLLLLILTNHLSGTYMTGRY